MKGRVAIAGMGCSAAGWRYGCSQEDLIVESGLLALEDAGLDASDIQASWFGCTTVSANHALLNFSLKLGYTAMTKVSNAGATGADALRNACIAVASGAYDIVLAAGVEKPRDSGYTDFFEGDVLSTGPSAVGSEAVVGEFRSPVHTSFYLARYAVVNKTPASELRQALTRIVLKNRRNGARNELAGFQAPLEEADVEAAALSVWPMTVEASGGRFTLSSECRSFAWSYTQDRNVVAFTSQPGRDCARVRSPAELSVEKPVSLANIAMFSNEGREVELSGPGGRVAMARR